MTWMQAMVPISYSGGRGNDTLNGGAGADAVFGGDGSDTGVFVVPEGATGAGCRDFYDGGRGRDTLRIELTAAQWAIEDIRQDLLAFLDHLDGGRSARTFVFSSLDLRVRSFENLVVLVDGEEVDPRGDPPEVIDRAGSTEDEIVSTGSGDDRVTTGSGNDVIDTGDGDDVIASGAGDDIVTIGDGDDVVLAGEGDDTVIAGAGGGNDFIDMGSGEDTFELRSLLSGQPALVDLRLLDRSANPIVAQLLAAQDPSLPAATPVGLAVGGDYLGTDVLLNIENVAGGSGNDTIIGNDAANVLKGAAPPDDGSTTDPREGSGSDSISGLGGADFIDGGDGDDVLDGGTDDDLVVAGFGDDVIDGGDGFDQLLLTGNRSDYTFTALLDGTTTVTDSRAGADGSDSIRRLERIVFADQAVDLAFLVPQQFKEGTDAAEELIGTAARDYMKGLGGDDTIRGSFSEDFLVGGQGNDILDGAGFDGSAESDDVNFASDTIDYQADWRDAVASGLAPAGVTVDLSATTLDNQVGTATDAWGDTDTLIDIERLFGTNSDDVFVGSILNDVFDPFGGDDVIEGGGGRDVLAYHLSENVANGTQGISVVFSSTVEGSGTVVSDAHGDTDTFTGIEVIRGTRFVDLFVGGLGDQEFRPYNGADTVNGGDGFDTVTYHQDASYGGAAGVDVDLEDTNSDGARAVDGFGAIDRLTSVESIRGTGAADTIRGDGVANDLRGEAGNDLLEGRGGEDTLRGQIGDDTLNGDAGVDVLEGGSGSDEITGGLGDDFLIGGSDPDLFFYVVGDGNDTITDFSVGADALVLEAGLTIAALAEADLGGDPGLDTLVTLSSGDTIALWDVTGLTGPGELLLP